MSSARVAANAAWVLTGLLMAAGWIVAIVYPENARPLAAMLAFSAVVTAVVGATLQIRIYMVKICNLIRRSSGLPVNEGSNVHAMR